jgi:phage protein D/phage baseplate assembly protein gpV
MPHSPQLGSEGVLQVSVQSDGQPLDDRIALRSVHVRRAVGSIPSARLVVAEEAGVGEWPAADAAAFQPGARVTIAAGYGGGSARTLFDGVVARVGLQISGDNDRRVVVDCRHAAATMAVERKSALHPGLGDSAVMRGLLQAHGLGAEVDEVTEACDEGDASGALAQYACTDWDFLLARARVHGLLVIADDDQVRVQAPQTSADAVLKVAHGVDLIDFQAEVDARSALQTQEGLAPTRGRLRFQGSAEARVGALIELADVGTRCSGKVFIAAVEHELADGHWLTTAEFGLPPDWQPRGRVDAVAPAATTGRLPGLQIGTVTQLGDPGGQGRVQVRLPALQGEANTLWARPMQFQASNGFGTFFMPEVGDEVVVAFLQHDPSQPVVLGSLYSSDHRPPVEPDAANDTKAIVTRCRHRLEFDDNNRRITLTTPAGNRLELSDQGNTVALKDMSGNLVELSPGGIRIDTPRDLTLSARGAISIQAGGAVHIGATADLKCTGLSVSCEAQTSFTGKGAASAELSAAGQTTVKGAMVLIN